MKAEHSESLWEVLNAYMEAAPNGPWGSHNGAALCEQAGLNRTQLTKIRNGTNPYRGTLFKLAEALRLDADQRATLERLSGHAETNPGFLADTHAEPIRETRLTMRRAILLLTAADDPAELPYTLRNRMVRRGRRVSVRSGVVFGAHDAVVRVTTPDRMSVLEFSDTLFDEYPLRTVETILLRDDKEMFLDTTFTNQHLGVDDYHWATIFIQALSGKRKPEFPRLFAEVAEREKFWGGIHLLTAAVTLGRHDSVAEVLAGSLDVLQSYVREAQREAELHKRPAHTVTYFATHLKKHKPHIADF
jgi:transcriptional regulator with XRE-family HTH domain